MIEFRQTGNDTVVLTTDAVTLEDICDVFQRFLLAMGFDLPAGAHIGYEYDDSYRDGGNEITACDVKDRCHWMLIDGMWWPGCDGESAWEVPPSGYCPNCGREVEVVEDEDVAERDYPTNGTENAPTGADAQDARRRRK